MPVVALSNPGRQRIVAPPVNESAPNDPTPVQPAAQAPAVHPGAGDPTVGHQGTDLPSPAPSEGGDGQADAAAGTGGGGEREAGPDGPRRRRRRRRRKQRTGAVAIDPATGLPVAGEATEEPGDEAAPGDPGAAGGGAAAAGGERAGQGGRGDRQARRDAHRAERQAHRAERGAQRAERHAARGGDPRRPVARRDSQHHAIEAVRSLAAMAQALLRIEGVEPTALPRYLDLHLRVPIDGGNDIRHAAGTAVEQILKRVREVREHEKALRPGAVYCYFAGSSATEGTRPTEPRQVFEGYSSTGKPIFTDFVTMAIERKDPQIDRLLAGEELVLTRVAMGRVLRTQQLAEFGAQSPIYRILGQVDAGLFKVLGAAGKCAFSFQLLRGTTLEGRIRLRMHAVGAVDPMDLADPAVLQILSRFQRRLDVEAMRLEGQQKQAGETAEVDEEAFVRPLLEDFARQLQSRSRSAARRTQHGLERSETGQRPTSRAYPDAGEAADADILWDVDQGTVVVLGAKGRVHVFTADAKHVTSVVMPGDAVGRRRNMGRWRLAEPEERGEFRIQVRRRVAAGDDALANDEPALDGAPSPS
jgi:hypothetical protein